MFCLGFYWSSFGMVEAHFLLFYQIYIVVTTVFEQHSILFCATIQLQEEHMRLWFIKHALPICGNTKQYSTAPSAIVYR